MLSCLDMITTLPIIMDFITLCVVYPDAALDPRHIQMSVAQWVKPVSVF